MYEDFKSELDALKAQAAATLHEHGLSLEFFSVAPEGDQVAFQLVAVLGGTPIDDRFDEVIAGAHQAEVEAQAERNRAELEAHLRDRLSGDDGIL